MAFLNKLKTVGTQTLRVSGEVRRLALPSNAIEAVLVFEADSTASDTQKAARWWSDGSEPNAGEGMLLGDHSVMELTHRQDLEAFRIIGIEPGKTHLVSITYYGF
ncbi:hypothetical protein AAG747_14015 [Rapidithrix thailandica]|uniref:Uncharacterized protein n=1 Tax=Rapidithrix thailandica TaxID=413964 RepID=A0AAW9SB92_9BACT